MTGAAPPGSGAGTRRRQAPDPVGALLAVASVVVFLLHGFEGAMSRDVAVYAYAGQQVAEGVPPYENILNRAGPLAHLVPGAGAFVGRSLGVDDLLAMRVTLMLVSVLAVWACYVLGRDLFRSRGAGAIAAVTLLSFQGFVTYATYGPREKTTMVLLVILALAATTHRRWAVAGAATALATLTWQGAFFPVAAGCLLAMVLLRGRRPRVAALLRWAGAGTAVTAAAIGYFALVGALPEFWEGFYAVNAGWTTQQGMLAQLADPQPLIAGYGWSLALLALGLVGCFAVAGARLRKLDRDDPAHGGVLALAAGVIVALLWALASFEGWPDAFVMLPYAACGVAGLVHLVLNRMPRPVVASATAVLVTAALVVAGIDATLGSQQRPGGRPPPRRRGRRHPGPRHRDARHRQPHPARAGPRHQPDPLPAVRRRPGNVPGGHLPRGAGRPGRRDRGDPAHPHHRAPPPLLRLAPAGAGTRLQATGRSARPLHLVRLHRRDDARAAPGDEAGRQGHPAGRHVVRRGTIPDMTEALDPRSFTYSIVIPVFNSERIVGDTIDRVVDVFTDAGLRFELILVNDGSTDGSWDVVAERAARLPGVVALDLLKNYGQHYANLAGMTRGHG